MCLLWLRSTTNKDGKIQEDDRPTSCEDRSKDLKVQRFSNIEENKEYEKTADTSFTKISSSIRKKLEAAINLDRSLNEDTIEDKDFSDLRAAFKPVNDNLEIQGLQNGMKNLEEEHLILEQEKCEIKDEKKAETSIFKNESSIMKKLNATNRDRLLIRDIVHDCMLLPSMWSDLDEVKYTFPARPPTDEEKKEYSRQMFLVMLLFLLIKNRSGNMKYKQTSCRKYPCLDSILYLLWQSGDVESNPGPPANSTLYRRWLYDVCSVVRKATVGVSPYCKMKNIWQQPPDNWPSEQPYFDPHNSNKSVNEVETFLYILIQCCDDLSILSDEIFSEIATWNSHNNRENCQLLNMYISRVYCRSVGKNVKLLISHLLVGEVITLEVDTGIQVILSRKSATDQQFPTQKMYRAEATRKIASFQCKILHGKDPEKKCDDIWTKKPDWWPSDLRFYNPNNGGKRFAKNEDAMLVEALITLCKQKSIILPRQYQDMVEAWRADNQTLLSKLLTKHTAETDLKKAVMKLHEEGLLQDPEVDKHLRKQGLLVQCDGSTHNVKSQKRKIVNTTNKHETKRTRQKRKIVNTTNKHETKRTRQSEDEDAVDTTLKELLPGCSFGQLLDNQSDSPLLDKISQNIPDFLGAEADDVQFHWT